MMKNKSMEHDTMKHAPKWPYILLASGLSLALAACSSGGGGSSNDNDSGGEAAALSGTGVKGIVRGAVVTARELNSAGETLRELGETATDNNGNYALTLSDDYAGGPIELVLSATPGTTTMVCDVSPNCGAVAFGDEVALDGTFEMTAMLSGAGDADELTTHITPFTHMAAQRARQATTIDATAVDAANSEVSNLLGGLDILRLQPVDITDPDDLDNASSTGQIYSTMISAIARIAYDDGENLEDTIELLATSFSDGAMLADDSSGDDAAQISLQEIIDSVSNQLEELGLNDNSGVILDLETDISNAVGNIIDPEPSENAGSDEIQLAKALMQDTRTWTTQLANLETPADTFATEVEMVDSITEAAFDTLGASLTEAFVLMMQTYVASGGQDITNTLDAATITVSTADGITTVVFDGTINTETVDITATFSAIDASTSNVIANLDGSISNSGASLVMNDIETATTLTAPIVIGQSEATAFTIDTSRFSGEMIMSEAGVVDPARFEGSMTLSVERHNDTEEDAFITTEVALSGEIGNTNNSFAVNASATLDNADAYDPNAALSASNFPQTTFSISFSATLEDLPQAQITLTLNTAGYDDTVVDEDEAWIVDAALAIAFGSVTLRLELSEEAIDDTVTFTLTATNQDGAQLVFSVTASENEEEITDISGNLTVAGETVAELSVINNGIVKVSYADGTFETLN